MFRDVVVVSVDGVKLPIIPAESIKGVLRSLATRIARSMKFSEKAWGKLDVDSIVASHVKDRHPNYVKELEGLGGDYVDELLRSCGAFSEEQVRAIRRELTVRNVLEMLVSLACPICQLFGAPHVAGKLLLYDAVPSLSPPSIRIGSQTSVAISRKTRIAEEGRLFTVRFVAPADALSFRTRMIVDNVERGKSDAKLLAKTLAYISRQGLRLGGGKSRGFGSLDVEVQVYRMPFTHPSSKDDVEAIRRNVEALLMKNVEKVGIEDLL